MKIEQMEIKDIRPYEKNPRRNDASVDAVANSIKEFGFKNPIIVDRDKVIITGHTRYKAAKKLGLKTVPVIIADDLTPAQVEAYRIADNSAGSASEWDFDLLGDILQGLDYDMSDFGLDIFIPGEQEPKSPTRGSEELDPADFEEDGFECECPRCHFRFNREGKQ